MNLSQLAFTLRHALSHKLSPSKFSFKGSIIEGYKIIKKVNQVDNKDIYIAENKKKERVIVKFYDFRSTPDDWAILESEFKKESELLFRFGNGKDIVRAISTGIFSDLPYLIMEYVEGYDLCDILDCNSNSHFNFMGRKIEYGNLDYNQVLLIAFWLARALMRLHEKGVVHGDVKPENIILSDSFYPVRLIDPSTSFTPEFLAPECFDKINLSHPTRDIYAFGLTLHETVSHINPFSWKVTLEDYHRAHLSTILDPPSTFRRKGEIPESFDKVVLKALAKKPEDRYQTIRELVRDLAATTYPARHIVLSD
ncbi:MAG: serine/threonine-protein kinase [Candidatus Micrarchaeota archaeon]